MRLPDNDRHILLVEDAGSPARRQGGQALPPRTQHRGRQGGWLLLAWAPAVPHILVETPQVHQRRGRPLILGLHGWRLFFYPLGLFILWKILSVDRLPPTGRGLSGVNNGQRDGERRGRGREGGEATLRSLSSPFSPSCSFR